MQQRACVHNNTQRRTLLPLYEGYFKGHEKACCLYARRYGLALACSNGRHARDRARERIIALSCFGNYVQPQLSSRNYAAKRQMNNDPERRTLTQPRHDAASARDRSPVSPRPRPNANHRDMTGATYPAQSRSNARMLSAQMHKYEYNYT